MANLFVVHDFQILTPGVQSVLVPRQLHGKDLDVFPDAVKARGDSCISTLKKRKLPARSCQHETCDAEHRESVGQDV